MISNDDIEIIFSFMDPLNYLKTIETPPNTADESNKLLSLNNRLTAR